MSQTPAVRRVFGMEDHTGDGGVGTQSAATGKAFCLRLARSITLPVPRLATGRLARTYPDGTFIGCAARTVRKIVRGLSNLSE
jgi:hypothetical protein